MVCIMPKNVRSDAVKQLYATLVLLYFIFLSITPQREFLHQKLWSFKFRPSCTIFWDSNVSISSQRFSQILILHRIHGLHQHSWMVCCLTWKALNIPIPLEKYLVFHTIWSQSEAFCNFDYVLEKCWKIADDVINEKLERIYALVPNIPLSFRFRSIQLCSTLPNELHRSAIDRTALFYTKNSIHADKITLGKSHNEHMLTYFTLFNLLKILALCYIHPYSTYQSFHIYLELIHYNCYPLLHGESHTGLQARLSSSLYITHSPYPGNFILS